MNINEILDQIERVPPDSAWQPDDSIRTLIDAYRAMEAENIEQARLLGMSAERELALLARAEKAERELADERDNIAHANAYQKAAMDNLARAEAAEAKVARLTDAFGPFAEIPVEPIEEYDDDTPVEIKVGALTWYGLTLHHFRAALAAMDETQ